MSDTSEGTIRFECETCGAQIEFPASRAGHIENCPECFSHVDVPVPERPAGERSIETSITDECFPAPLEFDFNIFPRPQWHDFAAQIPEEHPDEKLTALWSRAAEVWVEAIRAQLPPEFHTDVTELFRVLCPLDAAETAQFARFCDDCLLQLQQSLHEIASEALPTPYVVLAFATPEQYYDYVSFYYPDGESGGSAGMHITQDYPHIAMTFVRWDWKRLLAHELTHAVLSSLPIPAWIDEGLAQVFEDEVLEGRSFTPTPELRRESREYWSDRSLEEFWSGAAFLLPDDGQRLAYALAEVMVHRLLRDHGDVFTGFVRAAHYRDAGAAAAIDILNCKIADLAASFLGPGEWMPRGPYDVEQGDQQECHLRADCTLKSAMRFASPAGSLRLDHSSVWSAPLPGMRPHHWS
jgi:hypothetical protein